MKIELDDTVTIAFPNKAFWAEFYQKSHDVLVERVLRHCQAVADAEDAVEEAFYKLMHKKDPEAYGDKMPHTEKAWFWALYWQARAYLSHLKDRCGVHAKYVNLVAPEFEDAFAPGHQGKAMDDDIRSRALVRALETLKAEQDISRRDLLIYVCRRSEGVPSKEVAEKFGVTANNVDVITWRVGQLVRKHGPRHFEEALRHEGCGHYKCAA